MFNRLIGNSITSSRCRWDVCGTSYLMSFSNLLIIKCTLVSYLRKEHIQFTLQVHTYFQSAHNSLLGKKKNIYVWILLSVYSAPRHTTRLNS